MERSTTRLQKVANPCLPSGSASRKTSVGKWSFLSGRWPPRQHRLAPKSPTFRLHWKTRKSSVRSGFRSGPLTFKLQISGLRQRACHFLDVRHDRNVVVFGPRYFSLLIDDENGASRDAPVGHIHPVLLAHRTSWMKIREQGILDPHLLRIRFVRPHAVHAYPQHFRVQRLKLLHVVHKARVLACTGWAPVERIEHQHDFLLSREVRQFHFLLALILQREIRRRLSDRQAHGCFLQSICCRTASYRNTTARAKFSSRFIGVQRDWTPVPRASLNLSLLRTSFRRRVSGNLLTAHVSSPKHSVAIHSRLRERSSLQRIWTKEFGLGGRNGTIAGRSQEGLVGRIRGTDRGPL